jgi:zinc transport system substrate-binding protein
MIFTGGECMRYTIPFTIATAFAALTFSSARAEVPSVVTDMPPIQSLVAQVIGDLGTPLVLLEPRASPHSFQLRPSQAAAIADAGLIVWTGPDMAPWLDRVLNSGDAKAPALSLLAAEGTHLQPFALSGADDHDHEAGHDHAETEKADAGHDHAHDETAEAGHDHAAEAEDDHHHDHSGRDPHAWLDPDNATLWLGLIADELAKLDPANAATYAANAARAQADIAALDATLTAALAPAQDKPIIVFHDAYGYFASHYGLTLAGSVSLGDATSPGAARLRDLRAGIEAGTPVCIFPEAQFDLALVTQMADGTDIRVGGPLDPEGSTLPQGPGLYASLMSNLADTIASCLAGPA